MRTEPIPDPRTLTRYQAAQLNRLIEAANAIARARRLLLANGSSDAQHALGLRACDAALAFTEAIPKDI